MSTSDPKIQPQVSAGIVMDDVRPGYQMVNQF
jgi:hypothetical protein